MLWVRSDGACHGTRSVVVSGVRARTKAELGTRGCDVDCVLCFGFHGSIQYTCMCVYVGSDLVLSRAHLGQRFFELSALEPVVGIVYERESGHAVKKQQQHVH